MEKRACFILGLTAGAVATVHGLHSPPECWSGEWCQSPPVEMPDSAPHRDPAPPTTTVNLSTVAGSTVQLSGGVRVMAGPEYLRRPKRRPDFLNDNQSNNPGWL
jgi:hypothetical protein